MPTITISFEKWPAGVTGPFTTQEQLDACAEALWAQHIPSDMRRGWDEHNTDFRRLDIHSPNPDDPSLATAEIGKIAILFNGKTEALTPEEFEARGFAE
jgi:hypothetical protein